MNRLHPPSFGLGVASGLVIVLITASSLHLAGVGARQASSGGFGQGGAQNTARMAQRLGITQDELQKELAGGKTMQQIAQEHGVSFGQGRNRSAAGSNQANGAAASTSPNTSSSLSVSSQ